MQTKCKRILSMVMALALVLGMLPAGVMNAQAAEVPFSVTVGGAEMTDITESTLSWADWSGGTSEVPCYTVTVPAGSTEATLTFGEEMQWFYYNDAGVYMGAGETSNTAATTHTVKIQDAYKVGDDGYAAAGSDGELEGISVQMPDAWSAAYYIKFVYGEAGGEEEKPEELRFKASIDGQNVTLTATGTEYCEPGGYDVTVVKVSVPAGAKTLTLSRASQTAKLSTVWADKNDEEGTELENNSKSASFDLTAGYRYLCFWVTDGSNDSQWWNYHVYLEYQEGEVTPSEPSQPEEPGAPFGVTVNGAAVTDIAESTLSWADWSGGTSEVPCYTVTVPAGSVEAVLTFPEEMQCAYYDTKGNWIGNLGGDTMEASDTHTVALQDNNGDGELDGISVQVPDTYETSYYIAFAYGEAGGEIDPSRCLNILPGAPATGETTAGALYTLPLSDVFSHSADHSVAYSFETTVSNQHTKIKEGAFCFSTQEPGEYEVKLTAKCAEAELTHVVTITVGEPSEGIEEQYGYDETPKSTVTVYVTLSSDGYPIVAADGTVMANLEVTVPYFDLGLYGMENFYRYGTDGGRGPYTSQTVIQRPTGLHLYIYLLERYYMGLEEDQCCLGTSGVLDYAEDTEVYYMSGAKAYESGGKRALMTSGGATSIYMVNFWGHDENLMYFRNHCYPFMSPGWGSTSDYILLSDGDAWDVGMFSNWSFNLNGRYASFDKNSYTAEPGASLTVTTRSWGTTSEAVDFLPMSDLNVALYDSEWTMIEEMPYNQGTNTLTFKVPTEKGVYYLLGVGDEVCNNNANVAPAAARIIVGETGSDEPVEVSRILLNSYAETLIYNKEDNKTTQLTATVLPAEATGWTVTWTSSDEAVATVDETGLVTGLKEGTAIITAAIGEVKAECTVKVNKFNSAPVLDSAAPDHTKVKTGEAVELEVAPLFTDAEGDELTLTVRVLKAVSLGGTWEYNYAPVEGIEATVTDGKFSVTFPEIGIYAVETTASDGKLSASHTYQVTVVNNDAGVIALNDGVTMDLYNVVAVDASVEFVEDYEIPYKGTHDTYIHHIVLSKDTVDGGPHRKMDVTVAEGCSWGQYAGNSFGREDSFSTRAHIGVFAKDAAGVQTAHYLYWHTECATHTDENKDQRCDVCTMDLSCDVCTDEDGNKTCDVCGKWLNHAPTLIEGVTDLTVKIQTGLAYQLDDLTGGKIFEDIDGDSLIYSNYSYRKSYDGGETWGEWITFQQMEHGTVNSTLTNSAEGTYLYEFKANDGFEDSVDRWYLTLVVMDVVPADVKFYVGQDQNYKTNGNIYPVLELYRTAGIDGDLYDYVGWFQKDGETVYVYNPADYEIIDGETDYVVIDGTQYELHDYEKIAFTNSAFNDADETATPSGTVVSNYNMFYATVTSGRYSTRGYGYNIETGKYDIYLGGQSLELPMEKDIYGGGGDDIYLRLVSVYNGSKKSDNTFFTDKDYYVEMIMPVTGSMIHSGDPYVNGNYTDYPFLSYAAGNASLYNIYAYPYDTDSYIFAQTINNTTTKGYTTVRKNVQIKEAMVLTATVPEGADFGLYFQYNNFNTKEMEPVGEAVINGDGTKTVVYRVSKQNSNYTWRLSDPSGKYVTKAGWLKNLTAATEMTFTFSEFTDKATHDFSNLGTQVDTRDEADLQVFLSASGFKGGVTETTRVRAYRMWQIINSDSGNIMAEPEFNIQVLQGNAADIVQVDGGNAVGNWIDVTPTTTDIVAVNYNAIEMYSTSNDYGSHGGLYPATNPERTNVFIITNETAGTAAAHIPFNGSKETDRGTEWDYNYDTWFYLNTEEAPTLDFTVSGTGTVEVSYATVTTDASLKSTLSGWTKLDAQDGTYHVDLLAFRNAGTKGGTVIIKLTDSTGTSYALARVAEMSFTAANASNPGEPFMPGDQVKLTFDGLYRSVNKISGIFNPTTYQLRYSAGEVEVSGAVAQYQQMDSTSITLTIPADLTMGADGTAVYTFTNGYVNGAMYSASSPFQSMYYITDTGVGTNFSAVGTKYVLSRMADIPITVEEKVYFDVKIAANDGEAEVTDFELTLIAVDGTVLTPDEKGVYQDLPFGEYGYEFKKLGYILKKDTLKLGSADAAEVVEGILTKTISVDKAVDGAWDGFSVTEPKTDENGVYLIGTGAELAWFAQTVNGGNTAVKGILTADIDLSSCGWTPIGNATGKFAGSFDGDGHTIRNLFISDNTGASYQGLFGYVVGTAVARASIRNVTLEGSINITSEKSVGDAYTAALAGYAEYTDIYNCHNRADVIITRVKGNWNNVAGLVGFLINSTIENSSNTGTITGFQRVGGIVAMASSNTLISSCFNSGTVTGNSEVGGIAGRILASVVNCYNVGKIVPAGNYSGGIVGQAYGANCVITNCFNAGLVETESVNCASAIGQVNNSSAVVENIYYLAGTNERGVAAGSQTATEVSAETMASPEFVTTMNTGLEPPAYKKGAAHPILVWQADIVVPDPVVSVAVDKDTVNAGESLTVTLTLDSAIDDVMLAEFFLHYDTSLFTRGEATVGTALTGTTVSGKNVALDGTELKGDDTDEAVQKFSVNTFAYPDGAAAAAGTIVTVTFTAKETIREDVTAQFRVEFGMMQDKAYADIAVDVAEPVTVTVIGKPCEHDWADAACTEPKTCKVCGETEGEALGHTEELLPGKDATCTEPGLTDGVKCSVCGGILTEQEEIPAPGHDFKDGYCQICGEPDPDYEAPVDPTSPTEPEDPDEPSEPEDPTEPSEPDEPGKPTVEGLIRVAGDNRIGTSLKLADALKDALNVEKFEAVVVASAMNFPDALTGSYLANAKNAPILLTTKGFEDEVNAYIKANLADGGTVYVLGGEKAVPSELLAGVSGVKRVAGADRFGTNLAILKETGVAADQPILIATALNFADSLSASATGLPMLLVYGKLTAEQKAFLETTSKKFVIVGGVNAVSADLEAELKAIGSVERLAGASRYETSVMVAEKFISNPDDVVLAYARNFPDGLCGGPVAYALGAPLILTDNVGPTAADQYVDGFAGGIIVGGEGLISDGVARAIFDLTADAVIEKK